MDEAPHVTARMDRLEARMDALDRRQDDAGVAWLSAMGQQARQLAVVQEGQRIFEDVIREAGATQAKIAADVWAVRVMLLEHVAAEGRDRTKLLIGVVSAAIGGMGSLAVLIWGVYQVVERIQ